MKNRHHYFIRVENIHKYIGSMEQACARDEKKAYMTNQINRLKAQNCIDEFILVNIPFNVVRVSDRFVPRCKGKNLDK